MSGINYMFDTNALIGFFNKNENLSHYVLLQNKISISIISVLEFLSFKALTEEEKDLFIEFCNLSDVIEVSYKNYKLIDLISNIRINHKLKLPDAIIAASAIINDAVLITNDRQFSNVPNLQILSF